MRQRRGALAVGPEAALDGFVEQQLGTTAVRASGSRQSDSGLPATFEQCEAPYHVETEARPNDVVDGGGWDCQGGMGHVGRTICETGLRRSFGAGDEGVKETERLACRDDGDGSDDDGIQNASRHQLHHVRRCLQHYANPRGYRMGWACEPVFYTDGPCVVSDILKRYAMSSKSQ